MRPPRRSLEQLHLLGHQQRPELRGEALNEILVRVYRCPMRAAVSVVVELPEMDKLIDRASVGLEIADELLVLPALLKRWKPEFLVELHGLRHRADTKRIRSQFIESHRSSSLILIRTHYHGRIPCCAETRSACDIRRG